MKHTSNFFRKYVYSFTGVVLIIALLVAANAIFQRIRVRADLTEDKLYTISEGTKNILSKLKSQVTLRFYCSGNENQMPVPLRGFAARVEDLLKEYVAASKGKLVLEKFDPTPDSDAEDSAAMDGISGQPMPDGSKFYLGLNVNCLDKNVSIPVFLPHEENSLEYNITRAIYEAAQAKKPVLGILTRLPVMGGNMMPFMQNQQPKPPWIFVQELKRNFEVRSIENEPEKIPGDIDVLLVMHPQNLPGKTLFAIDQFLLSGGRLIVAVDPFCIAEQRTSIQGMMGQQTMPGSSSLPALFSAWGLDMEKDKVVVDMENSTRNTNTAEAEGYPAVLNFANIKDASGEPSMAGIQHLNLIFCGSLKGELKDGLSKKVLLASSRKSQLLNSFMAQAPYAQILKDFQSDDRQNDLIVRIHGKFKSAYPDGPPKEDSKDKKDGENKEDAAKPAPKDSLKESAKESSVVIVTDVDMFLDEFCVSKQKFLGRSFIQPFNDNLIFIQNVAEQLSGDNDLISIRCKKVKERPFTRLEEMQAKAQEKYQQKIMELEEKKQKAQERINQLQSAKSDSQKFILSQEQKDEIAKFKAEMAGTNKDLKALRKEFRKDIDGLMFRYEIANIALVPLLVVLFGLAVFAYNRIRSTAKQ